MEAPTLLYTKFLVPQRRREALARPELLKALRAGLKRRLLLVTAPPGYGKTTLLADFVARVKFPYVWYQLDANDGDPVVFFTYLTEGLTRALARTPLAETNAFGSVTRALLNSAEAQPPERVLAVLLNELARVSSDVLVVLEDYHHLQNPALHTLLDHFIEQAPPCLHLLISSRHAPPLSLARWRARQQLMELRAADLRLDEKQVIVLVKRAAPQLPGSCARLLSQRTEGWAAGIQLLLASLGDRDQAQVEQLIAELGGSHHSIFEYLAEESFKQQTPEVQSFLLRSAVLDQLHASVCNAVLNLATSQQILEELAQRNLFLIVLDEQREWYRYHFLYREFLRAKFFRENEDAARAQECAVGAYLESAGELESAVAHYLRARAEADAARVLMTLAPSYFDAGRVSSLHQLIEALPRDIVRATPWLLIYDGAALRRLGHAGAAHARLEQARGEFAARKDANGLARTLIEFSELTRSQGDYRRAQQLAADALSYTQPEQHDARARALMALARSAGFLQGADRGRVLAEQALQELSASTSEIAPTQRAQLLSALGLVCWWHGDPHAVVARCREALQLLPDELSPIAAETFITLSTPYLYWNELATAQAYAEKSLEIATKLQLQQLLPSIYTSLGNVLTRRGEVARGEQWFRQAIELSRSLGMESYSQLIAAGSLAFNLCQQGRIEEARQAAEAALWTMNESAETYEVCVCKSVLADVWLDAGLCQAAEQLYESMLELEERRQFRIPLGMVYFGLAYIYLETGRRAAGMEMVKKSLALIAPTNTYQLYLDQGERARVVCRAAQSMGLEPEFIHRVLANLSPQKITVAAPQIHAHCLGPLRVFHGGVEITQERWVSAKARDLFAYFVTFRQTPIPLDRIIEEVWHDAELGRGKPAFHTALYRLRHALNAPEQTSKIIFAQAGDYRLNREGLRVDVDDFENALRRAQTAAEHEKIELLEKAIGLYRGEYLENLYYDWCLPPRARWRETFLGALRVVVPYYRAREPKRAIEFAQRALEADPLLEDLHVELMHAYHALGDRAAAIRQYQILAKTLRESLDIAPGEAAQRAYRALAGG